MLVSYELSFKRLSKIMMNIKRFRIILSVKFFIIHLKKNFVITLKCT